MDKIQKFLKRLDARERIVVERITKQIHAGHLSGLDVKKLKGHNGLFRVRQGNIRIIFNKQENVTRITSIERRSENTYTF